MNIEAMGMVVQQIDKMNLLETNFKKYISDIDPSIKYLKQMLETNSKD